MPSNLIHSPLFENISQEELTMLIPCLEAESKSYTAGQIICSYGENESRVGILQSGNATLERLDLSGNRTVLEYLTENSVFEEVLAFSSAATGGVAVICRDACRVLFIDYEHLTKRCEKACAYHSVLVQNMLRLIADRALYLSERLHVLGNRSIREKLMSYFLLSAYKQNQASFQLPFSLTELADYICADRSAMMRELKKMKNEGMISIQHRTVTLS